MSQSESCQTRNHECCLPRLCRAALFYDFFLASLRHSPALGLSATLPVPPRFFLELRFSVGALVQRSIASAVPCDVSALVATRLRCDYSVLRSRRCLPLRGTLTGLLGRFAVNVILRCVRVAVIGLADVAVLSKITMHMNLQLAT